MPVTVEQAVTLTAGLNVHDGVIYIASKSILLGITSSSPASIVKWADPTDLSTFTSQTFASDGKHAGATANNIVYDSGSDLCYVVHRSYAAFGGGDNFGILISKFDPDDITTITTAADFDTGSLFNQGSPALLMTGGFLYVLTGISTDENARLFKVNPSTGAVAASTILTGTANHLRGHGFTTDGTRLYLTSGTATNQWAAWAELDLSAHSILDFGALPGGGNFSDDLTTIGSYFYANVETESNPSGTVYKIAKDLSSSSTIGIGYLTGVDGQYYDGDSLWVMSNGTLVSSGSTDAALVKINPATGATVNYGPLVGQTKVNEIMPLGARRFLITTFQTPAVAMRVSAVDDPVRVAQRLTYF